MRRYTLAIYGSGPRRRPLSAVQSCRQSRSSSNSSSSSAAAAALRATTMIVF